MIKIDITKISFTKYDLIYLLKFILFCFFLILVDITQFHLIRFFLEEIYIDRILSYERTIIFKSKLFYFLFHFFLSEVECILLLVLLLLRLRAMRKQICWFSFIKYFDLIWFTICWEHLARLSCAHKHTDHIDDVIRIALLKYW